MLQIPVPSVDLDKLRSHIKDVPDFPKPGILFRDIGPLLRHQFSETIQAMAGLLTPAEWDGIDVIGGIESRGFILAAGLAAMKRKGFVKIRKPGKLPGDVVKESYTLEYGEDALEIQRGQGAMLLIDDVLATGGTFKAAANVAASAGYNVCGLACLVNLAFLNQFEWRGQRARTLVTYEN